MRLWAALLLYLLCVPRGNAAEFANCLQSCAALYLAMSTSLSLSLPLSLSLFLSLAVAISLSLSVSL